MSLNHPVGNRELLKGCQQQSDKNKLLKRFMWFGCIKKGNRETSFYSYRGEPKVVVMGTEKYGCSSG